MMEVDLSGVDFSGKTSVTAILQGLTLLEQTCLVLILKVLT